MTTSFNGRKHRDVLFVNSMDAILEIALDLNAALDSEDRYERLLDTVRKVIPCDAAALMRVEKENALVPIAVFGLTPDTLGRRFELKDHPRLEEIGKSKTPVVFSPHSELPDPFDGLLESEELSRARIHACLGCPLIVDNVFIGALTADAVDPQSFAKMDPGFLAALGALAATVLRTSLLIQTIEETAGRQGLIARTLIYDSYAPAPGRKIIGSSPVMEMLLREIELVGASDFNVLIKGETGTGKELAARAVHDASRRRDGPFLQVNCAAVPENLVASELFGHERGAFTGAGAARAGKFEVADGGTLLLDEIGELPLSVQPQLLRALQEGEVQRVGADITGRVDVRVLASTNRDLEEEVKNSNFRADLFHRLNVYPLQMPPLRERREDIPALAGFFCENTRRRLGLGQVRVGKRALQLLEEYSWPGNVRELEHLIMRSALKASSGVDHRGLVVIEPHHLGADLNDRSNFVSVPKTSPSDAIKHGSHESPPGSGSLNLEVDEFKKRRILEALEFSGGNWAQAAANLGMHRSNLHHLAKRLGLKS